MRLLPILLFLPLAAAAAPPLKPFAAVYDLKRDQGHAGKVTVTLEYPKLGEYRFASETKPSGLYRFFFQMVKESSEGIIAGNRFYPRNYRYIQKQTGDNRDMHMIFAPDHKRIEHRLNDDPPWFLDTPEDVHDKMTQKLALYQALAAGDKPPQKMKVADGGRLLKYGYELAGKETVDTPAGRFETVKVIRHKGNEPPKVTLWLAKKIGYLPVRVERRKGKKIFSMWLKTLK